MRHTLLAVVALLIALPAPAVETSGTIAAEVERGVKAYNAQDLKYYEDTLATDAVYIAEDGAIFAGKEKVLRLFSRIFAKTPPRQLATSDLATGSKGDVAWARFKWTLTMGPESRHGVSSILFTRAGEGWQVVQIQSTPSGHAMPAAAPSPGASPAGSPKP